MSIPNPFSEIPGFNCFACGPQHPHGLHLTFSENGDRLVSQFTAREDLAGIAGVLHGGIQATLFDELLWWTTFHFQKQFCVTRDLKTEFLAAVKIGEDLHLTGTILKREKNTVLAAGELSAGGQTLARAEGSYFLLNKRLFSRMLKMDPTQLPSAMLPYLPD